MTSFRRLRAGFLALAASFLLLEGLLQVMALGVWFTKSNKKSPVTAGTSQDEVVMCVGDSFTHGIGATREEGAYPWQLEARLKAVDPKRPWRVINCGWSGQNSWDVLRRLDRQLADNKAQWLCVIVGVNDRWSNPALHELPPAPQLLEEGFRLELRTARLALLLRQFVVGLFGKGKATAAPDPGKVPDAPTPVADPNTLAWKAVDAGQFEEAVALFEQAIATTHADDTISRSQLTNCYMRTGRKAKAQEQLQWLERWHAEHPSRWSAESWVSALCHCGKTRDGLALARKLAPHFPDSVELMTRIGVLEAEVGDRNAAREPLAKAIELAATEQPGMRSWRYWERARIFACHEPEMALTDILTSHIIDPSRPERTKGILIIGGAGFSRPLFDKTLATLAPPEAMRQELTRLFEEVKGPAKPPEPPPAVPPPDTTAQKTDAPAAAPTTTQKTDAPAKAAATPPAPPLASHLRQIVRRAQAAGVKVVIGSYPCDYSLENGLMREVAQELHCGSVDCWTLIRQALTTHPRRELYAEDDAHCTDAGYAIMAAAMADEILRMAAAK